MHECVCRHVCDCVCLLCTVGTVSLSGVCVLPVASDIKAVFWSFCTIYKIIEYLEHGCLVQLQVQGFLQIQSDCDLVSFAHQVLHFKFYVAVEWMESLYL